MSITRAKVQLEKAYIKIQKQLAALDSEREAMINAIDNKYLNRKLDLSEEARKLENTLEAMGYTTEQIAALTSTSKGE